MEKHINEVLPGDRLAKDVVSQKGLLLLKKSTEMTRSLKALLKKNSISKVWIL